MRIADLAPGTRCFTQLDSRVLAVLSRREDGWCMYVGAVRGNDHALEWRDVASEGNKLKEPVALAIAAYYFHPGFDAEGCGYAR